MEVARVDALCFAAVFWLLIEGLCFAAVFWFVVLQMTCCLSTI
jgi:hypothetical protein